MDNNTQQILTILQEECAEVTQVICKINRFGVGGWHEGYTNLEKLEAEIGDLLCMVDLLVEKCIISDSNINEHRKQKREKLKTWSSIEGL